MSSEDLLSTREPDRQAETAIIRAPFEPRPDPGVSNVYFRICSDAETVLVFVHGFLSDSRICWARCAGTEEVYWPSLICDDPRLNGMSIFLAGYETGIFSGMAGFLNAADKIWGAATEFPAERGVKRVVDHKTIVFICHSQGGIVVRDLLVSHHQHLACVERVGLVLLGSPSLGSRYANLLSPMSSLFRNIQAKQLKYRDMSLKKLDSAFTDLKNGDIKPPIKGIEGYEHFGPLHTPWDPKVVSEASAGRFFSYRLLERTDHFSVAKPRSLDDPQHKLLIGFLQAGLTLAREPTPPSSTKFRKNSSHPISICRDRRRPWPTPPRPVVFTTIAILVASLCTSEYFWRWPVRLFPGDRLYGQDSWVDGFAVSSPPLSKWIGCGSQTQGCVPMFPSTIMAPLIGTRTGATTGALTLQGDALALPATHELLTKSFYDFGLQFNFEMRNDARYFCWRYRIRPYADMLKGGASKWTTGYLFRFSRAPNEGSTKTTLHLEAYSGCGIGGIKTCQDQLQVVPPEKNTNCELAQNAVFSVQAAAVGGRFYFNITVQRIADNDADPSAVPAAAPLPECQNPDYYDAKVFDDHLVPNSRYGNLGVGGTDGEVYLFQNFQILPLTKKYLESMGVKE